MNANEPKTTKHVLVVEDEPDFAALLRAMLAKAGYSVAVSQNCDDALAEAHKHRPDVITLDIQMPRKSGIFFYRKLKVETAFHDVPVVVVTGLTRDYRDMQTLIQSLLEPDNVPHPEAYVEKPVEASRFLRTIEDALSSTAMAGR